jgi:hypothetical protein
MSDHTQVHDHNATNGQGNAHLALGTVDLEIAGLEVTLPVRFAEGMVLTANQAKVLDAAYQRQFTNNQNAMAKAITDGKSKKDLASAAELAERYTTYEPAVGGSRIGSLEKLRNDAGWCVWVDMVALHNAAIEAGETSPVFKSQTLKIAIPRRKIGDQTVEMYRDAQTATVLGAKSAKVQERVQRMIDVLTAEREAAKTATAGTVVMASADDFA